LSAVQENPNPAAIVSKLVLNDPVIKALTNNFVSLDGIKNLAGNIPGAASAVGGAASAVGGVASNVCGGIGNGINCINPWAKNTNNPVLVSA